MKLSPGHLKGSLASRLFWRVRLDGSPIIGPLTRLQIFSQISNFQHLDDAGAQASDRHSKFALQSIWPVCTIISHKPSTLIRVPNFRCAPSNFFGSVTAPHQRFENLSGHRTEPGKFLKIWNPDPNDFLRTNCSAENRILRKVFLRNRYKSNKLLPSL